MMGKRRVFLVLICMLIVLACSVHVNAAIESGDAYSSIFVCVSDTECSPLIDSRGPIPALGEAGAALNINYSGITSKCVPGKEGNHYVWYQVDTDTPRNSGAADGKVNSNDTYPVYWDNSATYCTVECTGQSPIVWDSTEGKCCGDDGGSTDTWLNSANRGCDYGDWITNLDNSRRLCNMQLGGPGSDCDTTGEINCWDADGGKCCGDDGTADVWTNVLLPKTGCSRGIYCAENRLTRGSYVACCRRTNDYVESNGVCIPRSTYLHPISPEGALLTATGSVWGSLTNGNLYPYDQTVTLKKGTTQVAEIEGYFSMLGKDTDPDPNINDGYVDLSKFRIQADGASVYVNASAVTTSMNRISDEYTIFLPNNNGGQGIRICTDPEDPEEEREYGEECSLPIPFTKAETNKDFTVTIGPSYYEIETSLSDHNDWYAYLSIQPDLEIYSDTGKRSFEDVTFYAELKVGEMNVIDATCNIEFDDNRTETMVLNESDNIFQFTRQYTAHGTYGYEVICTPSFYLPVSSTDTVLIEPNAMLFIGDQTDIESKTAFINESINFYALYKTLPKPGTLITDASCNITYHDLEKDDMNYDAGEGFYSEDRRYLNYGRFSYTVKCARAGYDTLVDIDTVEVFPESCDRSEMNESYMVPGKGKFTLISKRGFVLIEKPG